MMSNTPTLNSWIACPRPNPSAKLRLFCLPYAGSGPSIYRRWPDGLPSTVELCLIHPPGRESRISEAPFSRLSPLVQALAEAVRPHLDRPFAFFGHSLGALVSFELIRHLRRQHLPAPVHLFVSGHRAPQVPDPDPPIHNLPEPELLEELRRLNGTPEQVLQEPELMQMLLPVIRADLAVCETYVYAGELPLACSISAFGGLQDHRTTHESLEAWREHTNADFSLRMLPGDHFFLHSAQPLLLRILSRELHHLTPLS